MDKIDVTKCSLEVQQQLRNQFIRLRKKGWKLKAISEAIGVCRSTVANWSREYTKGGSDTPRLQGGASRITSSGLDAFHPHDDTRCTFL